MRIGEIDSLRARHWSLAVVCAAGLVLAWHNRFVQDDAFISFTYAKHFVSGQGLTWFGDRIEGYSNFLWVLWAALGLSVGADPIWWAHIGSLCSFAIVIYATWRLAALLCDALAPRVIAVALFVTNYSVSAYATSGMETMLQTALLCTAVWQFYEIRARSDVDWRRIALLTTALAVAVLTRMDSLLVAGILGIWGLAHLARRRAAWRHYLTALLPFVTVVGAWLLWKQAYYGRVLPNSYYIKVEGIEASYANGLLYLARFFHWYLIWPVVLIGLLALLLRRPVGFRKRSADLAPMLIIVLAWFAYVVRVGGDFMEFRFIVPVAPYLFLIVGFLIDQGLRPRARAVSVALAGLCVVWLLGASYRHAKTFVGLTEDRTLDSIHMLATFYDRYPDRDWSRIGATLGRELQGRDVIIATSASGAIPYYSGIETIDMCGLNDPRVLLDANRAPPEHRRPGHQLSASLRYLKEAGVHLIIGQPIVVRPGQVSHPESSRATRKLVRQMIFMNREPIGLATAVAMPIDARSSLFMWYLTQHRWIDELIESGRWESRSVYVRQ